MRFEGKLEQWNDDRGVGFIMPTRGGDPVEVHTSAFQADGRRPRIGEALTFEIESADEGKRRAINVQRPGRKQIRTTHTPEPRHAGPAAPGSWIGVAITVVLVVGGIYAYTQFSARDTPPAVTDQPSSSASSSSTLFNSGRCPLQMRWPHALLANDVLRGGYVLPDELPGRANGRGRRRHPV